MTSSQSAGQDGSERLYLGGLGENMHWALNKALPQGMELKPWAELNEQQKALLIRHVNDMSSWRGEGRVDPALADYLLEYNPEFLDMMA